MIYDESYENFRICHFIACRSQPSAAMIMHRANQLKRMALNCLDLVRVRDCWYQSGEGAAGYGFVTLILLDYVGSAKTVNTIEHYIATSKTSLLTEMTALKWGRSVANGLQCMHAHQLIHGNIKASNVFLDSTGNAKLGDYPFLKSTAPQPLMKKLSYQTDVMQYGLFLYYVVTGGAVIPMNEFEECNMLERTMLKLVPVRFGETLKEVLRLALYHYNDLAEEELEIFEQDRSPTPPFSVTMHTLVHLLHHRIRELELITELLNARVLLLDNALNVIDDNDNGFYSKVDVCHAILKNSTVRSILRQDVELKLLVDKPKRVGGFIMKMSTKRGNAEDSKLLEAEDLLGLVKQMMITKNRDEEEKNRVREEEQRILEAEKELLEKNKKR